MLQLHVFEADEDGVISRTPTKRIDCEVGPGYGVEIGGFFYLSKGTPTYMLRFDRESAVELKDRLEGLIQEMDTWLTRARYFQRGDAWVMPLPGGASRPATPEEIEEAKTNAA